MKKKMPARRRAERLAVGNVQRHFQTQAQIDKLRFFPHGFFSLDLLMQDNPAISLRQEARPRLYSIAC
ncbi:hypothetical protein ABW48_13090 [Pluralibacter gergoviae]|nr:hypothetical protein ABW07_07850 [Pluralibacter gergoviae]KMK31441.1 hypothetical protein ABW12_17560 [Pluralibacter gergoviae]KMK43289.1 hypothetical protein ABW13_00450 [Pluralibacter gergoviae]KOQ98591.1 hypothetical protein ABW48_13090 [Pluralibacter gergoviae]